MAKLFQFSAFIGKLATLLLLVFFLHFDYFIIMSWLLFPWVRLSSLCIPFGSRLLFRFLTLLQSLSVVSQSLSIDICVCVCVEFSEFVYDLVNFGFFLLHPKLFLVLDKVNFNRRTTTSTTTTAFAFLDQKLHFLNVIFWVDSVYYFASLDDISIP